MYTCINDMKVNPKLSRPMKGSKRRGGEGVEERMIWEHRSKEIIYVYENIVMKPSSMYTEYIPILKRRIKRLRIFIQLTVYLQGHHVYRVLSWLVLVWGLQGHGAYRDPSWWEPSPFPSESDDGGQGVGGDGYSTMNKWAHSQRGGKCRWAPAQAFRTVCSWKDIRRFQGAISGGSRRLSQEVQGSYLRRFQGVYLRLLHWSMNPLAGPTALHKKSNLSQAHQTFAHGSLHSLDH